MILCGKRCRKKDCFFNRDKNGTQNIKQQICLNEMKKIKLSNNRCLSYINISDMNEGFKRLFSVGDVILIPDKMVERRKFGSMHHKKNHRFIITKINYRKHTAYGYVYSEPNKREREDGLKSIGMKTQYMFVDLIKIEFINRALAD